MAWKGVHIATPSRLSWKDTQLVVAQEEQTVTLPLEDVAWIVLDSPHSTLTAALVSACMEHGVAVIFTDQRHLPSGMALAFHRHHRQAGVAALQVAATLPLKKRLWQAIVIAKIENQARCLDHCGAEAAALRAMADRVGSGDPDNIEAQAARAYWPRLFAGFTRANESDLRNKMLNYGYAVARAAVARGLAASGLLPCFGLFHDNAANAFNLADDLLEPFRPAVDRAVARLFGADGEPEAEFTVAQRRALAGILNEDIGLQGETVSVLIATERAAASLVRALEGGSAALLELPRL
jgi:CRISPR-associated protein Cas1